MSNTSLPVKRQSASWRGLSSYLGLIGALLAMIVLFSFLSDHFLSLNTFSTIANQIPDLMVMSVGMTFVLIIAGIDLSVGSVLALSAAVVSVTYLNLHWSPWLAALSGPDYFRYLTVICYRRAGDFTRASGANPNYLWPPSHWNWD